MERNRKPDRSRGKRTAASRSRSASSYSTSAYRTTDSDSRNYAAARSYRSARRRRQQLRRRRRIAAAVTALVLLAGGTAFGFRQMNLQKQRQEYADQGIAALEAGNYEEAVTAFHAASRSSNGKIGAFQSQMLLYQAEASYRSGDYAAALEVYEKLYQKDESNETYRTGLALCLLETGDYDRALTLDVIKGQVYSYLAKAQIEAGNYDDALNTIETGFSEAGADEIGRKELTFNQAVAWEYKGDYKKALEILEEYDQKYTAEGNAKRELAFLKTRQGNHN